jgi:ADP-ribose pyrophosphatase YjhB (NUDIX family)
MDNRFCLMCGTRMVWRQLEGQRREVCPACGYIHYRHLKVAAAAVIERDDRLLLLKRAHAPWQGDWNLPAGYVEADESPSQAAVRETREETGLKIQVGALLGEYFFNDDPRGNGLLLVYHGMVTGGQLTLNTETDEAAYFSPDELPENICGAGHRRAVAAWRQERLGQ